MALFKSLLKDTAIYGLSSIVGRFLNYLLFPLYTAKIAAASGGYGVITNVYSYTALLFVMLTFGMETTLFRFMNKTEETHPERVYSTTLITVGTVGLLFVALVLLFLPPLSRAMGYAMHPEYIAMMAIVVALDAFQAIPFCYLRYQKKAVKFAALKMSFIVLNIALNLLYFLLFPTVIEGWQITVGQVFIINLLCTVLVTLGFWRELFCISWYFDGALLKKMWSYAWPILILGIAGILNQTLDKILYPLLVPGKLGAVQLGIYGAAVKIAMIMALITQAFRYAYEPFVFAAAKENGNQGENRQLYATTMKYFLIFTLLAFLVVEAYLDVFKHILAKDYWEGLHVVPVVMVAEILMGVYFNLSFWYKLTDRTIWGAWFSGIGCLVLFLCNYFFIPQYGYMACAWAGVAGYGTAVILSYVLGQCYYPIPYPLRSLGAYCLLTAVLYGLMQWVEQHSSSPVLPLVVNTLCLCGFVAYLVWRDFPLSSLPYVGKYFKK